MNAATIQKLRAETPGAAVYIHLNNAGAALTPMPVFDAICTYEELEMMRGGYETADLKRPEIDAAYESVARLIHTKKENIAFTTSATDAYSRAVSAIPFRPDDVVLIAEADYASNQITLLSLVKRFGIKIVRAKTAPSGAVDVDDYAAKLDQYRPKLASLTHVPTNSGLVQPAAEVGRLCKERNVWFLLDACQSVGQMDVDVQKIPCDFLSVTARKFLRGPRGMGFLYVSDRALQAGLAPLFVDMYGATWTQTDGYRLKSNASRFEDWEFNYALLIGTGEAARYATTIGITEIEKRIGYLAAYARKSFSQIDGVRLLDRGERLCGIITLGVAGWKGADLKKKLTDARIHVSVSTKEGAFIDFEQKGVEWALRVSPHYYNTEAEIDAASEAIRALTSV